MRGDTRHITVACPLYLAFFPADTAMSGTVKLCNLKRFQTIIISIISDSTSSCHLVWFVLDFITKKIFVGKTELNLLKNQYSVIQLIVCLKKAT